MEDRLEKLGFKRLLVHEVPMGAVLSSETAGSFPLIDSGGYAHEDGHNIVTAWEDGLYQLVPPEPEGKYFEQQIYNGAHSLEEIVSYFEHNK